MGFKRKLPMEDHGGLHLRTNSTHGTNVLNVVNKIIRYLAGVIVMPPIRATGLVLITTALPSVRAS